MPEWVPGDPLYHHHQFGNDAPMEFVVIDWRIGLYANSSVGCTNAIVEIKDDNNASDWDRLQELYDDPGYFENVRANNDSELKSMGYTEADLDNPDRLSKPYAWL